MKFNGLLGFLAVERRVLVAYQEGADKWRV